LSAERVRPSAVKKKSTRPLPAPLHLELQACIATSLIFRRDDLSGFRCNIPSIPAATELLKLAAG
jgi:hypothetical protein